MKRFDLLFSYWIFAWYLFYIFGWTTYNPKFALLVGILENTVMLLSMYKTRISTVLLFIIAILLFKIIPLFSITRIIQKRDVVVTFLLLILYIAWLYINGHTLYYLIQESNDVIHNKTDLPFTTWIKKTYRWFFKNNAN